MILVLASASLALALLPAILFTRNLRLYRSPQKVSAAEYPLPAVSVLIPARNEEASIASAVESALASRGLELEVIVLDDHSEDSTAEIVGQIAARDPRVRLEHAPPLPPGWCGKQHACHVLSGLARHPVFAFLDADVRLEPDGLARSVAFLGRSGAELVSGVPRQFTGTLGEKLVLPLIHFILLGFLPIGRMRGSLHPSYAAGCGQLIVCRRDAYRRAGGHAAIRQTLHDGLRLPRAFRAAGLATDLFDATGVAACRMYRNFGDLWQGLAKNATEGLAAPAMIVPATLVLFVGQVLPLGLLVVAMLQGEGTTAALAAAAVAIAYWPRWAAVLRFRQSPTGAILHPFGVLLFLAIQWHAFLRKLAGGSSAWKGRTYESCPAEDAVLVNEKRLTTIPPTGRGD